MKNSVRTILVIFVLLLAGCCFKTEQEIANEKIPDLTLAEYERIPNAATYDEVVKIIGSHGMKTSETLYSASYSWENPDGSFSRMTFFNGKLRDKYQQRLK